VTIFAITIAITKDLPDVEGDRQFEINTFASRLGVRNVTLLGEYSRDDHVTLWLSGSGLLICNYVGAAALACLMPHAFNPFVMIGGHAILTGKLVLETLNVDQEKYRNRAIKRLSLVFEMNCRLFP